MIRVGIVTLQWKSDGNFSSVARARFDLQRSADRADAFAHGDKSQPFPGQSLAAAHFKSSTIVPDGAALREILSPGTDPQLPALPLLHPLPQPSLPHAIPPPLTPGPPAP